jgi:arylsulfatase A-like enzyme
MPLIPQNEFLPSSRGVPRARRAIGAAALGAALLAASCAPEPPSAASLPPDVMLVVIDTLRADEMAWLGPRADYAPVLARLASEGVVFPRTWSHCSWTKPSTTSIVTGLVPLRHGVVDHLQKLSPDAVTVAEMFAAAGYRTAAVVANRALYDDGFRQGFEEFQEVGEWIDHSSDQVAAGAREKLEGSDRTKPLFLYVHFLDPHDRYIPPEGDKLFQPEAPPPTDEDVINGNLRHFEGDTPVQKEEPPGWSPTPIPLGAPDLDWMHGLYRGELHASDRELGAILADRPRYRGNPLLLVVTSDHGESFFEHGMYRHGWTLHEEVLRVPLLFAGTLPRVKTMDGGRIARSVDIVPTILDLAGLPPPAQTDGTSLAAPPPAAAPIVHGLTHYHVQRESFLVEWPWKLIVDERFGKHELYDLETDPHETSNQAAGEPARLATMLQNEKDLRAWETARRIGAAEMSGEELEQLEDAMRGLGYIK